MITLCAVSPWFLAAVLQVTAIEHVAVEIGDGRRLDNVTVVFDEKGIREVGPQAKIPDNARRIDGAGKVLTPGFIDSQSQVGLSEVEQEAQTHDDVYEKVTLVPAFQPASGFNPLSVWLPVERESGVTSALLTPRGGLLSGQMHWVALEGALGKGPNLDAPVALSGSVGHGATGALGGARGALWLKFSEVLDDARLYAKNKKAFEENRLRNLSLPGRHLEALNLALTQKVPLVLEANRASDILAVIAFSKAQNFRLIISGAAEAHLVASELAAAKVPVILTPSSQMPSSFDSLRARDDVATFLEKAKVEVIIAAQDNSHRRLRQEAGIAVAYGMSRSKALAAITGAVASAFRLDSVGLVAPQKRADVVLWSGDPLELSSRALQIFVGGIEQGRATRQSALVERYLKQR
jgi:imidazolonepropionase-like amidohydrolase